MSSNQHFPQDKAPTGTIELRVEHLSQLFDTLDPFPFPERDLDADADEYIVGWARELPRGVPITIVVHLPAAELETRDAKTLPDAVRRFYSYRAELRARELKDLFRVGRVFLLIGLAALAICFAASQFAATLLGDTPFGAFVEESLIIVGWVANWKPLEIFLYDWWPLVRARRLYLRLAAAKVTCRAY